MRNTGPLSQEFMFLMSVAKKLLLKKQAQSLLPWQYCCPNKSTCKSALLPNHIFSWCYIWLQHLFVDDADGDERDFGISGSV